LRPTRPKPRLEAARCEWLRIPTEAGRPLRALQHFWCSSERVTATQRRESRLAAHESMPSLTLYFIPAGLVTDKVDGARRAPDPAHLGQPCAILAVTGTSQPPALTGFGGEALVVAKGGQTNDAHVR
jgi:hypothetical protein